MCGFDSDNLDDLTGGGFDGINNSVDGTNDDYSFNPIKVDSSAGESLKIGYNENADMLSFGSGCSDCSGSCIGSCADGCIGISYYD